MRIASSVTTISWIPSEAIGGLTKLPFEVGITHYDEPPPDVVDDLEALRAADRFRFANEHRAWIDVEDGAIVGYGHDGGGRMGVTKVRLGGREVAFTAFALPDLQPEPEVGDGWVRFVQTAGDGTRPRTASSSSFRAAASSWTRPACGSCSRGWMNQPSIGRSRTSRSWRIPAGSPTAPTTPSRDAPCRPRLHAARLRRIASRCCTRWCAKAKRRARRGARSRIRESKPDRLLRRDIGERE